VESYKIDRNSWHYKVTSFGVSAWAMSRIQDICQYRRWFLYGLVKVFLAAIAAVWVSMGVFIVPTYQLVTHVLAEGWSLSVFKYLWFSTWITGPETAAFFVWMALPQIAMAILLGIVTLGGSAFLICKGIGSIDKDVQLIPGFISTAWKSAKEKYCLPVKFTNE